MLQETPTFMHILYIYTDPANPESSELLTRRTYGALYADSTADRPALQALLQNVSTDDTLHIVSETHLGKDMWAVIQVLQALARKGAKVFIKDSEAPMQAYMPITEQVVKALGKFRNVFIQRRARTGTKNAMQNGVKVGRPTKPLPKDFAEAARKWYAGETTSMAASASIGMPFSTFIKKAHALLGERT